MVCRKNLSKGLLTFKNLTTLESSLVQGCQVSARVFGQIFEENRPFSAITFYCIFSNKFWQKNGAKAQKWCQIAIKSSLTCEKLQNRPFFGIFYLIRFSFRHFSALPELFIFFGQSSKKTAKIGNFAEKSATWQPCKDHEWKYTDHSLTFVGYLATK